MNYKWIGAVFIITGCSFAGLLMALNVKRESEALKTLSSAFAFMIHELTCRLTCLPELCRKVSQTESGCVSRFFATLSQELDGQVAPDVSSCVCVAVSKTEKLPEKTKALLLEMGKSLGQFDLNEQVSALRLLQIECAESCAKVDADKAQRLRNYETLGLCAGAALAILLL